MYTIGNVRKHKNLPASESFVQYFILSSEPKETAAVTGRSSFQFRNRYLAKRQVMRTIRRLRRERTCDR